MNVPIIIGLVLIFVGVLLYFHEFDKKKAQIGICEYLFIVILILLASTVVSIGFFWMNQQQIYFVAH